jgi:hypothetical protein
MTDEEVREWQEWVRRDRTSDPPVVWPECVNYPGPSGVHWDHETASDGPPRTRRASAV